MNDPIVMEVRRHRDEHAREFGYNIDAICESYRQKHEQYVRRLKQVGAGVRFSEGAECGEVRPEKI